jgi:hypothetical protein
MLFETLSILVPVVAGLLGLALLPRDLGSFLCGRYRPRDSAVAARSRGALMAATSDVRTIKDIVRPGEKLRCADARLSGALMIGRIYNVLHWSPETNIVVVDYEDGRVGGHQLWRFVPADRDGWGWEVQPVPVARLATEWIFDPWLGAPR